MRIREMLGGMALGALLLAAGAATAQQKEVRIGAIFDYTGPFAAGGSEAAAIATKLMIDWTNKNGGIEGYKIVPIYADAQSKAEVAIAEAERLINQEKVDLILGVYSSAHCVPMSQKVDAAKKFMWATVCTSSAVFKDKGLQYVFRPQAHTDQFGAASCDYIAENSKAKLGIEPKDLKIAMIYEDGPYGAGVAAGNEETCIGKHKMQNVLKEGYSASAPDLSSLVTKLRRARPDVILHVGYNPDITLFLRQSKEQGLKFKALVGHGAGHSQIDKLKETFGNDVNFFHTVDPPAAQLLDAKTLAPGIGELTQEMIRQWQAVKGDGQLPPHVSMGWNNTWIFLHQVLPIAIKKYGGVDSESLRKAALDLDIAPGGTMQGYGVRFAPPGDPMAGQNIRSFPIVMQYVDFDTKVVFPTAIKTVDPVLPFPKGHTFAP